MQIENDSVRNLNQALWIFFSEFVRGEPHQADPGAALPEGLQLEVESTTCKGVVVEGEGPCAPHRQFVSHQPHFVTVRLSDIPTYPLTFSSRVRGLRMLWNVSRTTTNSSRHSSGVN